MATVHPFRLTNGVSRKRLRSMAGAAVFLFDIIVPTALFYMLTGFGIGIYLALLASAGLSAVTGLIAYLRGSRRDSALLMLLMALAGLGIAFVTGSDRFLLARESVLTAIAGGWFLWSLRAERPLTYRFTRPLLEGRWHTTRDWEGLWTTSPRFRQIWRMTTVMWGIATLIDAALRVAIAYTLPIKAIPALQTGLMIATMLLMQVITNAYYVRAGLWTMLRDHHEKSGM